MPTPSSLLGSPAARLGAFGVMLAIALGGGALVGATVGPDPSDGADVDHGDMDSATAAPADAAGTTDLPAGLAVSLDGYTLHLHTPVVAADQPAIVELTITGPDGRSVTDYDVEHDKELHLIVASRDLAHYAHVHPSRDDSGRWSVDVPAMPAGSYRVFADFTPVGGDGLTLGADLTVPGDHQPAALPDPSTETTVDGYDVSFDGDLVAGTESQVTITVTRDGEPVTDLAPYLGALGHLVALRNGDLAYLHVHPLEDTDGPGGPSVRFAVEVPTAGTYGLFFDFSHDTAVRTATVIGDAIPAGGDSDGSGDSPESHDEHES